MASVPGIEELFERSQQHLLEPVERVFRVDVSESEDGRHYATLGALTTPLEVFVGVTTPSQRYGSGNPRILTTWQKEQGIVKVIMGEISSDADLESKEDMHRGTFVHSEIETFVKNGLQYDKLHIPAAVSEFLQKNHYSYDIGKWVTRFERGIRAFSQWIEQEGIEILGVEVPVVLREIWLDKNEHVTYEESERVQTLPCRVASCIDLVVRDKAGQLWIVDVKSGEKSYKGYKAYRQQLSFYEIMLLTNYPVFRGESIRLANWSPKKWNKRSRGWYYFDEQERVPVWFLHNICQMYWYHAEEDGIMSRNVTIYDDNIITPRGHGVTFVTYYEYIQRKIQAYLDAQKEQIDVQDDEFHDDLSPCPF